MTWMGVLHHAYHDNVYGVDHNITFYTSVESEKNVKHNVTESEMAVSAVTADCCYIWERVTSLSVWHLGKRCRPRRFQLYNRC